MKVNPTSTARLARSARGLVSRMSFGAFLVGGMAALAVALPASTQAANLGEVCNTNRAVDVWQTGTLKVLYEVPNNTPMRIENWAGTYYYIAHAEGKPNGEVERAAINQASCHTT